MLGSSKTKRNLVLLGGAFILVILVVNPFQLTTVIVNNLGGNDGGGDPVSVDSSIKTADGVEVQDGDEVSGVLTIEVVCTSEAGYLVDNAELIVDGSKWSDMTLYNFDGNNREWEYGANLDTTQLSDGEHEVEVKITYHEVSVPDGGDGGDGGGQDFYMSILGFNIGSGGGGNGDDNDEDSGLSDVISVLFLITLIGIALVLIVRRIR